MGKVTRNKENGSWLTLDRYFRNILSLKVVAHSANVERSVTFGGEVISKYEVNKSISVVVIGKRSSGTHKLDDSKIYQSTNNKVIET